MMRSSTGGYTVKGLAERAGVTPRTIYYYVSEGLLPRPEGGGPTTSYRAEHLARLRLIRRLKEEYLPLAEIRRRLAELSAVEVESLLARPSPSSPAESAREYLARVLDTEGPPPQVAPAGRSLSAARRPRLGRIADPDSMGREAISDWRRLQIDPDMELHIRRDARSAVRKSLPRIVAALRGVLEA